MLVHEYSCIFHWFLRLNPHIYFQFPSLQFLVLLITSVFFFSCSAWLHFPEPSFLFVPPPPAFPGPHSQCLLWTPSSRSSSWPFPQHWLGSTIGFGLILWPVPALLALTVLSLTSSLSKINPFRAFYTDSVFQRGMKKFLGMVTVRSVSHRQTRPSHPRLLPTLIFPFQKLLPASP